MALSGHNATQARMNADLAFIQQSADQIAAEAQQGIAGAGVV